MDATVRIRPSLTLSVTRDNVPTTDVTLNLDPASNPFDSEDLNIAVSTNNKTGYTLTMTTSDNGTNLVNVADSTKTIPTLTSSTTAAAFPVNKWGYKKDSGNYQPFVTNTQILTSNTRTNEDTTTLSFAAKVDYTKESGLYKQDLVFAATPNMVTYYMQDLDPAVCSKDPIEAIDLRDNNTYYIAELDDGNCWMLQNLQLGNTLATTSGSMTLTPDDSNISLNYILSNKVSGGIMPYTTVTDDVSGSTGYVYDGNAFYCTPDGTNSYVGCYYNWYTATAGKGTSNITSGGTADGVDVNESICPRGWVLPSGGLNGEFRRLITFYPSSSQMLVDPMTAYNNTDGIYQPGFLLSGLYYSGGPSGVGTNGAYWSRTAYSTANGSPLGLSTTGVGVGRHAKYDTESVRCVRESRTLLDIENMQDISPAIVGNTNVGAFKQLKDTRDNQYYMVGKLEDGNIWMLDNLNIDLFANKNVISPSNTHITGTVGINGLNAFKGTSVGTTSDRYATGAIASVNSDSSGNWTSSYSYSVPLQNRSGRCDSTILPVCLSPYENSNYTYDKVIDKYGIQPADESGVADVIYNIGYGNYKIGTYYNLCAVSLGTYCHSSTDSAAASANAEEADICPLGWRLPIGGAGNEYQILATTIQSNHPSTWNVSTSPYSLQTMLSTPVAGYYNSGSVHRQGGHGYFYTSMSAGNNSQVYGMDVSGTGIAIQITLGRYGGHSARCLAH